MPDDDGNVGVDFPNVETCYQVSNITLSSALSDDYGNKTFDKSSIADDNGEITVAKGITAATTTVVPSNKPTPKPNITSLVRQWLLFQQ